MYTSGEVNANIVLWVCVATVLVGHLIWRLSSEVFLIDAIFALRHSPAGRLIALSRMSICCPELEIIDQKHLTEFLGIFSVKENPKIQLKKLQAFSLDRSVSLTRSEDSTKLSVTFGPDSPPAEWNVHTYTNIPIRVLKEVFFPETSKPLSNSRGGLREIIKEFFCGPRKFLFQNDEYKSIDEVTSGHMPMESVGQRIDRVMRKYQVVLETGFTMDLSPDDSQRAVPFIVICEPPVSAIDSVAQVWLATGWEDIKVYFEPKRPTFVSFSEISDFYGIEEGTCMICCDAPITTLLMDCCHCCLCESCANSLRDGRCPICRKDVTEKIVIPIRTS
jgi:hypothetical protein